MRNFKVLEFFKRWWWILILVSLIGALAFYSNISSKQTYTAECMIEYVEENASSGLTPSNTPINVNELQSSNVIYGALDKLGVQLSVDTVRNGISIIPILNEDEETLKEAFLKDGEEYSYFPVKYIVRFTLGSNYSEEFVRRALDAILAEYFTYYATTYVEVNVVPNNSAYALGDEYDYLESVDIVNTSLNNIMTYLEARAGVNSGFRSSQTGYNFNDILLLYKNLFDSNMNRIYALVLENAISKDSEALIEKYKKLNATYNLQILSLEEKITSISEIIRTYVNNNAENQELSQYDNNTLSNMHNVIEFQSSGAEINNTTSYDTLVSSEVSYKVSLETLKKDIIYNNYIISQFQQNRYRNTEKLRTQVKTELSAVIAESKTLYGLLLTTVNEYNEYLAVKNVLAKSSLRAYNSINTKLYFVLAFIFFLFAGVALSIGIRFISYFISKTLYTDSKTNLPNRITFDRKVDKLSHTPLEGDTVCMIINLHNLGTLNEEHGREAGDIMMANLGKIIENCSQGYGTIYYNGGTMFCGFFLNCVASKADLFRKQLHKMIDNYNKEFSDTPIDLTSSFCEANASSIYDARELLRTTIIRSKNIEEQAEPTQLNNEQPIIENLDNNKVQTSTQKRRQRYTPVHTKKKSYQRFFKNFACVILCLSLLCGTGYYFYCTMMDNSNFKVTFYEVESDKISTPVRTVHLTDLHTTSYGKDNIDLLNRIASLKPDFISITGDMLTHDANYLEHTKEFCKALTKIAPVYYSLGNHEIDDMVHNNIPIVTELKETGVILLHNQSVVATYNDNQFVIGGLSHSQKSIEKYAPTFLPKFLEKTGFRLLLTHYPKNFDGYLENEEYDVALAGDAHGGHTRLPFFGALYANGGGFFPKLTEGIHQFKYGKLIISRGLSNDEKIPRINNIPELLVIDFQ